MKKLLLLALLPSYIAAGNIVEYDNSIIPYMYVEYGPGTVLAPGTRIYTTDCLITGVDLDSEGVFTIFCEEQ